MLTNHHENQIHSSACHRLHLYNLVGSSWTEMRYARCINTYRSLEQLQHFVMVLVCDDDLFTAKAPESWCMILATDSSGSHLRRHNSVSTL